ncbi:MAG: DUF4212 domain-containing protein [Planctomycetota bacterium]
MSETNPPGPFKPPTSKSEQKRSSTRSSTYWAANLKVVGILLTIWFLVAFVGSIFSIEWLNQFRFGTIGFGFWLAQQGSIFVFVLLVLIYALWMDRIDRQYDVGE